MVKYRLLVLGAVLAIVAAACAGAASPSPTAAPTGAPTTAPASEAPTTAPTEAPTEAPATPKAGGTLVVGLEGDIVRTDPSIVDDLNSIYVSQQVVETLVTLKPGTGDQVIPMLADSWTISPDGLTYTFKLHPNVKFQDGTDFNAEAVKFNVDRWINIPESYVDPGYTYYIDTVFGHGANSKFASTAAPDASTFVVTLKEANSSFLIQLTLGPFGMQSPKALTDGGASAPDFKDNKYATGGPPAMVGTGPFMFKEWVPGDHVTVVKNPGYWNAAAGGPYLDQVTFKPIGDTTARVNAIQSGGIDLAEAIAPLDVPSIQSDANLQVVDRGSACNAGVVGMNQTYKPFDNLKIRQAVAHAINRQDHVTAFFGGEFGLVLNNWAPPGVKYVKDLVLPEYDPEKAKALIAESGVTDLSFDFWYPSGVTRAYMPDPKGQFEAILSDLEKVGFKPNPKTEPWGDYTDGWTAGNFPMFLAGWNCDWNGIDNFLVTAFFGYQGGKPNASYGYKNDAMNQAMVDALKAADPATQQADWEKAQDMILADMPSVPLGASKTPGAIATYVKGFMPSPTLLELFTNTWLDK